MNSHQTAMVLIYAVNAVLSIEDERRESQQWMTVGQCFTGNFSVALLRVNEEPPTFKARSTIIKR
jgi:hypothetical protein